MTVFLENLQVTLQEINVISITVRLLVAVVVGFILGAERGIKGKAAGIKTYILVCMGSALTMILSQYIIEDLGYDIELTRLSAQVISGIGFLGAGTILVTGHNKIVGLSTAAGLWATACIGLVAGIGFYEAVVVSCVLMLFIFGCIPKLEEKMYLKLKSSTLYTEFSDNTSIGKLINAVKSKGAKVVDINIGKAKYSQSNGVSAIITIKFDDHSQMAEILSLIGEIEGLNFLEKI